MIDLVTRISISPLRGLMGQDFNPRSKNEFPSFKSWVEVNISNTLKFKPYKPYTGPKMSPD